MRILGALGFPCATNAEFDDSRDRLRARAGSDRLPPMVTTTANRAFRLPFAASVDEVTAELVHEDGVSTSVTLHRRGDALVGPPISTPGYYRLRFADREVQLAVAPRRCVSIADIAAARRRWGIAVQLYSLARGGNGGIGDTRALQSLVSAAARHGADAIALSPVHSLFAANGKDKPLRPSNRLFLNPLYADPSDALPGTCLPSNPDLERLELINWPDAAGAKYAALREIFDKVTTGPRLHSKSSLLEAELGCASTPCSRRCMPTGWAEADVRPTGAAGRKSGTGRRCPPWSPSLGHRRKRSDITNSCSGWLRFRSPAHRTAPAMLACASA